jgi:structural maintenance of chromosome 1
VLDEVDSALDPANVGKLANYIIKHAGPMCQFIVISLKHTLYQKSESLVGIFKDLNVFSSRVLTLMVSQSWQHYQLPQDSLFSLVEGL